MAQHRRKTVVLASVDERAGEHDGMIVLLESNVALVRAAIMKAYQQKTPANQLVQSVRVALEESLGQDAVDSVLQYLEEQGEIDLTPALQELAGAAA